MSDPDKNKFYEMDEAGMGFGEKVPATFWPAMARCPDCGRFMKRGIVNWVEHQIKHCPSVGKKKAGSGILKYTERNYPAFLPGPQSVEMDKLIEEYWKERGLTVDPHENMELKPRKEYYFPSFTHPLQEMIVYHEPHSMTPKTRKPKKRFRLWKRKT